MDWINDTVKFLIKQRFEYMQKGEIELRLGRRRSKEKIYTKASHDVRHSREFIQACYIPVLIAS